MTTVYAVFNSNGCVGRCDATCHDAKGYKCVCICGGRFHGRGKTYAVEQMKELLPEINRQNIKHFAEVHGLKCEELTTVDRLKANAKQARRIAAHDLKQAPLPLGGAP